MRNSTGMALTPAGEIVVRSCEDIMLRVTEMTRDIGALLARQQGEIKVMANTTAILLGLFEDVETFCQQHESVRIQISEGASVEVADAVKRNEVDVCVAVRNARMSGLQINPYRHTGLSVMMRKGHVLKRVSRLTNQDLRDHEIIWLPPAELLDIQVKHDPSRAFMMSWATTIVLISSASASIRRKICPSIFVMLTMSRYFWNKIPSSVRTDVRLLYRITAMGQSPDLSVSHGR